MCAPRSREEIPCSPPIPEKYGNCQLCTHAILIKIRQYFQTYEVLASKPHTKEKVIDFKGVKQYTYPVTDAMTVPK